MNKDVGWKYVKILGGEKKKSYTEINIMYKNDSVECKKCVSYSQELVDPCSTKQ